MATYTCPQGHSSQSDDYCDVCGAPMGSSAAPVASNGSPNTSPLDLGPATPPPLPPNPGPGSGTGTATKACPNCQAANLPDALFCEDCGYDFTTGQLPRPLDPPAGLTPPTPPTAPPASPPATPAAGTPVDGAGATVQPPPTDPAPPTLPPAASGPAGVEYVVEVWVDPDWYAAQDVDDPCPSAGMPVVVPLQTRSALVGRTSTSRNIHPEIDLSTDTGVSRRHAQLTSDGLRWWVEDLQSANGTYVGSAGAGLPSDPIPAGQKVEIVEDGRIYVGAWTRLVVRKATAADLP